jgi:hypothetical protein
MAAQGELKVRQGGKKKNQENVRQENRPGLWEVSVYFPV